MTQQPDRRVGGSEPPLDPQRQSAHIELLVLLCIVEQVNAAAARAAAAHDPEKQPWYVHSVLQRVQTQLCRAKPAWERTAVLDGLRAVVDGLRAEAPAGVTMLSAKELGGLIERQCAWLLKIEKRRSSQRRRLPEARRISAHWHGVGAGGTEEPAAPPESVSGQAATPRTALNLIEECLEPFTVAREYMRTVLGTEESLIESDLQQFILRVFRLRYRKHYAVLANLCARTNELYFGAPSFQVRATYKGRPPLLDTRVLLASIRDELRLSLEDLEHAKGADAAHYERLALGFLLAFRFCMLARLQTEVPSEGRTKGPQDATATGEDASALRVGVRLLQPLVYTNLRARVFGSLPGIAGWSEIFGGGLLPGVELGRCWVLSGAAGSGKTSLALHLGADMAAREHLVVYFSLEESYDNISDRVVAFRLYQPERFDVAVVDGNTLEERVASASAEVPQRGLLLYYRGADHNLHDTLRQLRAVVEKRAERWRRTTAIIIDSVDALEPPAHSDDDATGRYERRKLLRELIQLLEKTQFSALLLTEAANPELPTLQHLADTYLEVGVEDARAGRWLQVHKSRLQDFMRGRHGYGLRDGRGAALVPNLRAVQRLVARRIPAALSENRVIPLPEALRDRLPVPLVQEKSSLLIWGNDRAAMLPFWLHLLTEPSRHIPFGSQHRLRDTAQMRDALPAWEKEALGAVLVISFRTASLRFLQTLRQRPALQARWNLVPTQTLTWYQPHPGLTGARIVADLRDALAESRVQRVPIERVVFDEIDAIDSLLPHLAEEREFWPTIFGLLATEPLSVMYVVGSEGRREPQFCRQFAASMDYCCKIWSRPAAGEGRLPPTAAELSRVHLALYKHPVPTPAEPESRVSFRVATDGSLSVCRESSVKLPCADERPL